MDMICLWCGHKLVCIRSLHLCLMSGRMLQLSMNTKGKIMYEHNLHGFEIYFLDVPEIVLSRILIERLWKMTANKIWEVSCSFMSDREHSDQILACKRIIEKWINTRKSWFFSSWYGQSIHNQVNTFEWWDILKEYVDMITIQVLTRMNHV